MAVDRARAEPLVRADLPPCPLPLPAAARVPGETQPCSAEGDPGPAGGAGVVGSDPAHARAPVPDGLCLLLGSSAPWLLGPSQAAPGPRASQAAWLPGATRPVPDPSLLSPGSATLSTPAASGLPWPPVPSALAVPEPHPIWFALWLQRIGTFLQAQSPLTLLISPTCPSPAPWARAPQQGEAGALPAQPLGCSGAGLSAGPGAQACFLSSRPARAGCGPRPPPAPGLPPALLCSSPLLTRQEAALAHSSSSTAPGGCPSGRPAGPGLPRKRKPAPCARRRPGPATTALLSQLHGHPAKSR